MLQAKEEVKTIIGQYQAGELEAAPGRTMQESFESKVRPGHGFGRWWSAPAQVQVSKHARRGRPCMFHAAVPQLNWCHSRVQQYDSDKHMQLGVRAGGSTVLLRLLPP